MHGFAMCRTMEQLRVTGRMPRVIMARGRRCAVHTVVPEKKNGWLKFAGTSAR